MESLDIVLVNHHTGPWEAWESWHTVLKVRHWILPCINPFSTTHLSESVGNMRCACHWMCLTHSNKDLEILQIHWSLRRATVEAEVPASSALEPRQRSLQTPIKYRCFWIFDKGCKETWETPITCCNIWGWASFKNDIPREKKKVSPQFPASSGFSPLQWKGKLQGIPPAVKALQVALCVTLKTKQANQRSQQAKRCSGKTWKNNWHYPSANNALHQFLRTRNCDVRTNFMSTIGMCTTPTLLLLDKRERPLPTLEAAGKSPLTSHNRAYFSSCSTLAAQNGNLQSPCHHTSKMLQVTLLRPFGLPGLQV